MASQSDLSEFSSPTKRRKIDFSENVNKFSGKSEFVNYSSITSRKKSTFEEGSKSDCCDSGFTELDNISEMSVPLPTTHESLPSQDFEDEDTDTSSQVSSLSDISGLEWKPMAGPINWVQKQILKGANPRHVLTQLAIGQDDVPDADDMTLWRLIINMLTEPPRRSKLRSVNTLNDVIQLLKKSSNIIVLTGAGVSVSCGIPDFRSRNGIYARLAVDFPDLPDPHSMFDIGYFYHDPRPFYKFAKEIFPGLFKPSPCHRFIKLLEKHKKLLRNYSQNIDTLEQVAGIEKVIECHGSFATASCTKCKFRVNAENIREDIFCQRIPICPKCWENERPPEHTDSDFTEIVSCGIMKPDIVFFGEGLPDSFHEGMAHDKNKCDLLIVIGSSLKVRPVGLIPSSIPSHVPQILINRERLEHLNFDVELLGDSDVIINQICHLLGQGWNEICTEPELTEVTNLLLRENFCSASWISSQDSFDNTSINNLDPPNDSLAAEEQLNSECTISEICISPFHAGHMDNNSLMQMDAVVSENVSPELTTGEMGVGSICHLTNTDITNVLGLTLTENQVVPRKNNIDRLSLSNVKFIPSGSRRECANSKERHMSIDSARDSGIGDGSNSVDSAIINPHLSEVSSKKKDKDESNSLSLAKRLPSNSYYLHAPNKYIFSGAEVYINPDDEWSSDIDESDTSISDSESDCEYPNDRRPAQITTEDSDEDQDWTEPPEKKLKKNSDVI